MQLDELTLRNFRNYKDVSFSFDETSNVIFGENAQGKTNLLEAIAYICTGESPRTKSERELLRFSETEAGLTAKAQSRNRDFHLTVSWQMGKRKQIQVNGVKLKRAGDLSDVLCCVYFCPEDLLLIRSGAAERRKFLDNALRQLLPRYAEALKRYRRCLEQKTRILRDYEENPSLLELLPEFNEEMAKAGALLIYYRARYIAALARHAEEIHSECSGRREHLSLSYETVSTVKNVSSSPEQIYQWLKEHQASHALAEKSAKLCLSGPHKDDISIAINGENAKSFASQGQCRTAALALKMAEREILYETKEEYPLLLLDDVLSELDKQRQDFVLNRIQSGQVFITCCEDDRLREMLRGKVFHIKDGILEG